jgi:hypothetical protein
MYAYRGTLTEADTAEVERMKRRLLAGPLFIILEPLASFHAKNGGAQQAGAACGGRFADDTFEPEIDGVQSRIPWKAVTTYSASESLILVVVGHVYVPVARHFFGSQQDWEGAKALLAGNVIMVEPDRQVHRHGERRTIVLWLALLAVIWFAWHFAQIGARR